MLKITVILLILRYYLLSIRSWPALRIRGCSCPRLIYSIFSRALQSRLITVTFREIALSIPSINFCNWITFVLSQDLLSSFLALQLPRVKTISVSFHVLHLVSFCNFFLRFFPLWFSNLLHVFDFFLAVLSMRSDAFRSDARLSTLRRFDPKWHCAHWKLSCSSLSPVVFIE